MLLPHWGYFLALEKEFIETIDYVELDLDNYKTFSIKYTKIIQASCAEIDVVCKLICKTIDVTGKADGIYAYRKQILKKYPRFHEASVDIPRYGLKIRPWYDWLNDKTPDWWDAYNGLKHERYSMRHEANLKNSLYSLSALFVVVLYYYQDENYDPLPELFHYDGLPMVLLTDGCPRLPDS